ncbi:MAG: NAD-glutamate dehydrogenase [Hyphomicrobiales bacterium]
MSAESQKKNEIVDMVVDILTSDKSHQNSEVGFETFLAAFLKRGNEDDYIRMGVDHLCEQLSGSWDMAQSRKFGSPKITIHSDTHDNHDAQSYVHIINDDTPFLFDSILNELNELSHSPKFVLHPLIIVKRDAKGALTKIVGDDEYTGDMAGSARESHVHIVIDKLGDIEQDVLIAGLEKTLENVRYAVQDWKPMGARLQAVLDGYIKQAPNVPPAELEESMDFLRWLMDDNFTFLGLREYCFESESLDGSFVHVADTSLGVLRDLDVEVLKRGGKNLTITPEILDFILRPEPIFVAKANIKSVVHRRIYMDYIGLKLYDANGDISGELKLVGLFTSGAYTASPMRIPLLRRKLEHVIEASGLKPSSHSGKALTNVLESYPRDELFQIEGDLLLEFATSIQRLDERPLTRAFIRPDKFDRFVSVLVYVARDHYNSEIREKIGEYLAERFDGRVSAVYPSFPEGMMARAHFIIGRNENPLPAFDALEVEAEVHEIIRTWKDKFFDELDNNSLGLIARELMRQYGDGFSAAYRENFSAATAIEDIAVMHKLREVGDINAKLVERNAVNNDEVSLKLYHYGEPIALSDRMPIIENMGFRAINERSYCVKRSNGEQNEIWIHDISLESHDGNNIDISVKGDLLQEAFLAIWKKRAEDDGFNKLILSDAVHWRDVAMLRTYGRYLKQAGLSFSQRYVWDTLRKHGEITAKFVELFHMKFNLDDKKKDLKAQRKVEDGIIASLEEVSSLDEDRIIRAILNVMQATIRTNFYQKAADGNEMPTISLKIRSRKVDALPDPKPLAEIFVYSPRVEGVHLRGGEIARGGLRWSDRLEDFRTEVLGLVKAQQVKNAVIVPVGSKGGFVPKHLPVGGTREEFMAEGIACYKLFVGSLLDITDNLDGETVIPPKDVVRLDKDDPYLVVAADKGTATFSDIANGLSDDRGFWLSDAFASGGSVGYDHKVMGITARGGWEAVKRHFREENHDIQNEPFRAIGVGDMSGDVFGNGMLLSEQTKLVAAFDHRDIFIDPDPDVAKSFVERKRLFEMPRSSWVEYNKELISKGGGIFSRALKSIPLSDEIREMTGLTGETATPNDLMRALLCAETDLLWFGGIGTYIRATTETNAEAGDRANDAIRITAPELKAKVLGEGANLGITHNARIEFAKLGGKINTDAIDNSAGVNSSDMEVNIKIALGRAVQNGKLNYESRNVLLASMTDEVAKLVLRNNYLQTLSITLAGMRNKEDMGFYERLMLKLEETGELNREIEFLPDSAEMAARETAEKGLERPELAVLLAYAKISLYETLLKSDVVDDEYLGKELYRYFPETMHAGYKDEIEGHKLRREIIATRLSNLMINRGGPAFVRSIADQSGAEADQVASAFAMAYDSFELLSFNDQIDDLDSKIDSDIQLRLYMKVQNLLRRQTIWFLRHVSEGKTDMAKTVGRYKDGIKTLVDGFADYLPAESFDFVQKQAAEFVAAGVPKKFAEIMASTRYLDNASDIVRVAERSGAKLEDVAKLYFSVGDFMGIQWLVSGARKMPVNDLYDRLAVNRTIDGLQATHRRIVIDILSQDKDKEKALALWKQKNADEIARANIAITNVSASGDLSLAKLAVASAHISDVVES